MPVTTAREKRKILARQIVVERAATDAPPLPLPDPPLRWSTFALVVAFLLGWIAGLAIDAAVLP